MKAKEKQYYLDEQKLYSYVIAASAPRIFRAMDEYAMDKLKEALEMLVDDGFISEHMVYQTFGINLQTPR